MKASIIRNFFLTSIFLFTFACTNSETLSFPREFDGKVIKIKDGDTIDILFNGKPITVRFAHIDCPEKKQPFGKVAKHFTSEKCFGQIVTVQNENKYDRYNRLIGIVINENNENLNKELIKAGLAWHYKKYSSDIEYARLEENARIVRIGLWKDEKPIAPWDWR